jgi:DNA-binding MarR family transcriptional regulator
MSDATEALAISLFSELLTVEQMARSRLTKALPSGMELSHFSVLNQLARSKGERTPAQLAKSFHVTRGAMTNTLRKLEQAGHIIVRPDWDDARKKLVSISPSGRAARDAALAYVAPVIDQVVGEMGQERVKQALPILREIRGKLTQTD